MKSWRKLREFARFKERGNGGVEPTQDIEEITRGMQDVQHIKAQYEGLHAVSSRVVGRAYGLSEAIQELAHFLDNTFGVASENGEINQVYKEVSRVQFELSKLLHLYALHVSGTLTLPTESLLNELDHIEETKKLYDEKRSSFDQMRVRKAKAKGGKTEGHIDQLLQESKEQFDELAMILGCRLHSLEQSRPRNLITQAVRHHAAQMHLFKQGLGSLDNIDSYIARVVHDRNLDQSLDYLDGDNEMNSAVFDSKAKEGEESDHSSSLEQETSPSKQFEDRRPNFMAQHEATGSRSAPISPIRFVETNGVNSIHEVMLDGVSKKLPLFSRTNSWMRRKASRDPGVLHLYRPTLSAARTSHPYSVTEPSASPAPSWKKTPDLQSQQRVTPQRHHHQQHQQQKKLSSFPSFPRRTAQSGPLDSAKPRLVIPGSGPLPQPPPCQALPGDPLYKSGPLNPSPKMSPAVSPSSPPRVSELHKLPPPPLSCTGASTSVVSAPAGAKLIAYSAPLSRPAQLHHQRQQYAVTQCSATTGSQASPLPPPPLAQAPSPASNSSKGGTHRSVKRNEERVSPLPPNLSPNNNA